ncbi:class I SAM-dependent methyltransferase [Achromobacter xylosoxidans]|uniref:class I SAM-dependent methyltransferase n=1 Tax=Alcaligenes xylosoxydans xylosoxydans TaxID=85698 RepID=UPI001567BCED|nr:class I SAM-dependent methyltransferase [Achromobacter xylosoxidans]QKI70408.1 class I SAM-dependent methyltransferase [Achromobacter xylosoxidans]
MMSNAEVSEKNAAYWDEMCGSHLAKTLGITDSKPESLRRFDDWYFDYYPYLADHIRFDSLDGKHVLEVGLGYGSVSQRIAEAGARYQGLDIAAGPVALVNTRLAQRELPGRANQGSILAAPFPDEHFDQIVAIGCLHHTGDLVKSIGECHRLLKPGGSLVMMVYYAYSARRYVQETSTTLRYLWRELLGYRGVVELTESRARASYDANSEGNAAPHTDAISGKSLMHLLRAFRSASYRLENISQEPPFQRHTREQLLATKWPQRVGLDIYATALK